MSEECDIIIRSGSFLGTNIGLVATDYNSPYAYSASTTNTTQLEYYLIANDGNNDSAQLSSLIFNTYMDFTPSANVFFDGIANTTAVDFNYSAFNFNGESSMTIELSTDINFSSTVDTIALSSSTVNHLTSLFPVTHSWRNNTYYARVEFPNRITTRIPISFAGGVKPNPSNQQHTMYISTTNQVDIYYLELPFGSTVTTPSNWMNGNLGTASSNNSDFDSWLVGPFGTSATRFVRIEASGSNMPMFNFYFSPVNYTSHSIILWTRRESDRSRISSLTVRYSGNIVITYIHSTEQLITGINANGASATRWKHTWVVDTVDYTDAATS
jgi:hypothetical protein